MSKKLTPASEYSKHVQFQDILNVCLRIKLTGHKVFLWDHHLRDGAAVDGERLEELGALTQCLRMLHNDAYRPRASPVRYLDPVTTEADKLLVLKSQ